MAHLKKQVRDSIVSILSGATAAGTNVFTATGDYPKDRSNLPYIGIRTAVAVNQEVSAGGALGSEIQVEIELSADGSSLAATVDALDALEVEVFSLLSSSTILTGTLAEQYTGTELPEVDVDADRPTARQVMSYVLLYRTPRDGSHETVV